VSSKKKKKKKKASGSEVEKILPIFEDRTASANLLGGCVGPLLPPPDTLLESRKYAETASHFLRAVASMNRMVHSYDSAMRSNMEVAGKLAEAESRIQAIEREKNEALSEAAAAKLEKEEVERTAHVNKENAIKMAEQNLKANSEIVRLKRMLSEARGLRDSEVARAVQTTRREVSETFIAKMKNAEHKVSLLDEVNDRFMYLSQARANAQLIEALEGGGVLESEKEQVDEWLKDFADAEVNLNRFMSELKDDLKAPAPEPAPLSPGGHRSVESLADEAGITDQAGSLLPAKDNRPSEDLD
jgi:myosin heavy subunit